MNNCNFVFEWSLNEKSKILEEIPVSHYESYLLENGTIAEEIFATCALRIMEQRSKFLSFDPFELFNWFADDFFVDFKEIVSNWSRYGTLTKDNYIAINFDLLEKIALTYVYDTCKKHPHGLITTSENSGVIRILNEIIGIALTSFDDKATADSAPKNMFVTLQQRKLDDYGLQLFRDLIEEIKKSNIRKAYIREDTEERKCIALYKKWAGEEITIAFSGHYDCLSEDLYAFFNIKDKNKRLEDYLKIAKAIGAELAPTSNSVSRYDFGGNNNNTVVQYDSVKEIMCRGKIDSDYYSCCERKIFAYLVNKKDFIYSGKMFVKYPPCRECMLAILYHLTMQGKRFSVLVGLPTEKTLQQ